MSVEVLRNLMLGVCKELNFIDFDLKIEPISSGGANYTSTLYNVTVTEGERVVHLFGKVAAGRENIKSRVSKYYDRENFVYNNLLKVYKELEEEHKMAQEHRLVFPKFYGYSSDTYEECIVLENIVMSGYQSHDRFKSIGWEYAKSAISSLAKLHALSFAYAEYYPEEFKKLLGCLDFEWDADSKELPDYFKLIITRAINSTREENREKLKDYFKTFDNRKYRAMFKWSRKPMLRHGDFRASNVMYKIRGDGTVETKVVDLQTIRGANPVVDLLFFIYTGSDEQFRAKYYHMLLDHYYTELHAAMTRLHLKPEEIYSRDEFSFDLEKNLEFGLVIAVYMLPIVIVNTDGQAKPERNGHGDLTKYFNENISPLYIERINGVVNDYVKFGILK